MTMRPEDFKVGMKVWSRTRECFCYFTLQCEEMMKRAPHDVGSIFLEVEDEDMDILEMTAYLIDLEYGSEPKITVSFPINVPKGHFCWEGSNICEHFDNEGDSSSCTLGFSQHTEGSGRVKKGKECLSLIEIKTV